MFKQIMIILLFVTVVVGGVWYAVYGNLSRDNTGANNSETTTLVQDTQRVISNVTNSLPIVLQDLPKKSIEGVETITDNAMFISSLQNNSGISIVREGTKIARENNRIDIKDSIVTSLQSGEDVVRVNNVISADNILFQQARQAYIDQNKNLESETFYPRESTLFLATKDALIYIPQKIRFLSSFKYKNIIYWFYMSNYEGNGERYLSISEQGFRNPTKLNQFDGYYISSVQPKENGSYLIQSHKGNRDIVVESFNLNLIALLDNAPAQSIVIKQ